MPETTHTEQQIEDAILDVADRMIAATERCVSIGYDDHETSPLAFAERVIAALQQRPSDG